MRALIKDKQEVARETLLVTLDLLGEEVDFVPGQYFFVTLPDAGHSDERGLRRHISVVTSPGEKGVLGFATRMRDSAFKNTLRELPVGAEVDVEQPKGSFALPESTLAAARLRRGRHRDHRLSQHAPPHPRGGLPYRVTLLYSNRDRESTAFLDELAELEHELPGLRLVLTMTQDPGWDGETRKIDAEFLSAHLDGDLNGYTYLVAGPPAMAEGVQGALEEAGVAGENVVAERYSGY